MSDKVTSTSSFPHHTFGKEVAMYRQCLRTGELHSISLRIEYLHILFGFLLHESFVCFPLLIYLFNHLFKSVWTYGYLLYTLGYTSILFYFVVQTVPDLVTGISVSRLLCPFHIRPSLFLFCSGCFVSLSGTTGCSRPIFLPHS